ncbi:hypothetical protein niasHT_012175 [Heterodera trifolii]|uniref:Uncharacterized protein n=1 Tax=Heterodera trifolii TaxID=157864 RepID=A0ABD2KUB3_9BILA
MRNLSAFLSIFLLPSTVYSTVADRVFHHNRMNVVRRQLLQLPHFLNGCAMSGSGSSGKKQKQYNQQLQQQDQNGIWDSNELEQYRKDYQLNSIRSCYFSPVQCLLITPGQHRAFVNHPKFNQQQKQQQQQQHNFEQQIKAAGEKGAAVNAIKGNSKIWHRHSSKESAKDGAQHRHEQHDGGDVQVVHQDESVQHHQHLNHHHRRRHRLLTSGRTLCQHRHGGIGADANANTTDGGRIKQWRKKYGESKRRRHPIFGNPFRIGL